MSMHGVVAEFEEEQTPVMPLVDPDAELALVKRQRRFGKFVPRWFLTLIGTKLSLLGTIILVLVILAAICAPLLTSIDPTAMTSPMSIGPSPGHPFGTNSAGQDIYSQTLYGARFSLAVGVMTGIAITVIAIVVGMIAGYIGGWIDDFLSMVMNIFLIIPQLPLLIVIGAYIPLSNDQTVAIALRMTAILTFTGWAWGARVMRAQTLSLRSRDFVDAAVVNGESKMHIIFRDILPNMLALTVNTVILSTMGAILTESALDFLGLGAQSQVTWGTMLNFANAQGVLFNGQWWCFVFPGCAIALTVMAMIFMNNGVDAIANPRLRKIKAPRPAKQKPSVQPVEAGAGLGAAE